MTGSPLAPPPSPLRPTRMPGQGHWWWRRRLLRWHRATTRIRPIGDPGDLAGDPWLAALRGLPAGLTVDEVSAVDGARVGVGCDDAGWFAAASLTSTPQTAGGMPLDALVQAVADVRQPGAAVQFVTHRAPDESEPDQRASWVAVRLDARRLAEAGAHQADGAPAVISALIRRLARAARRLGCQAAVLDRAGLLAALVHSYGLQPPGDSSAGAPPREDWLAWHAGGLAHRTFWLRDWPPAGAASAFLDGVGTGPATFASLAVVLVPSGDLTYLRCLIRLAAPAAHLDAAAAVLTGQADRAGARLLPLNGEHGPAAYATAPTGGGPW